MIYDEILNTSYRDWLDMFICVGSFVALAIYIIRS